MSTNVRKPINMIKLKRPKYPHLNIEDANIIDNKFAFDRS